MKYHVALTLGLFAILHFVADFLLQPDWMAKKKSEDPLVLAQHVGIHFGVFFLGASLWGLAVLKESVYWGFGVAVVNAGLHAVIDWNVWRSYKRYAAGKQAMLEAKERQEAFAASREPAAVPPYRFWEDHWFYVVIGADQLLHGLSLILAFLLATG